MIQSIFNAYLYLLKASGDMQNGYSHLPLSRDVKQPMTFIVSENKGSLIVHCQLNQLFLVTYLFNWRSYGKQTRLQYNVRLKQTASIFCIHFKC